ncbi:MAG: hypothetical protein KGL52_08740 [Rhodospirillales bacterium]|nr:hypothetical protein [Rhodospirillales bacterium]
MTELPLPSDPQAAPRPAFPPSVEAASANGGPAEPTDCHLAHRLFASFGPALFRRSDVDDAPVMVVQLGEREAALPLRSLQREFGIPDASEDGRMLARIAESLDFVSVLRPGDPLPREVLTGEASWEPDPLHLEIAQTRLRVSLVDWLNAGGGSEREALDAGSLLAVGNDPQLRQQVHTALARAAEALGLQTPAEVVGLLETLGRELAYIEALRDRLLRRVRLMAGKIERLSRGWRGDASHIETLTQVKRLTGIALRQILGRFEELDAQTGEVMAALRNVESQRAFIRSNRDWLYRSQRAWEPILAQWDTAAGTVDKGTLALLVCTYQFLAPRFMPVTEWISSTRPGQPQLVNRAQRMIW